MILLISLSIIADLDDIPKNEQERKINTEFQIIYKWRKSNKLFLNCKKAKIIVFYKPPRKTVIPELLIDNEKFVVLMNLIFWDLQLLNN